MQKLIDTARAYLMIEGLDGRNVRFDVISIKLSDTAEPFNLKINHIKDAFQVRG